MIRLVVLGTTGAVPSKRFHASCFAVKYGGVLLFDACEGVQRQLMKYGVSFFAVNAVFLSHLHADHLLGLFGLIQSMNLAGRKEALKIVGPAGCKKFLETVLSPRQLSPDFNVQVKEASSGLVFSHKLFKVKAFKADHGCPALGFVLEENPSRKFDERKAKALGIHGRLFTEITEKGVVEVEGREIRLEEVTFVQKGKKIVYSGDSRPCPSLSRAAKDADLLIHDSCFSEGEEALAREKAHSTCVQAAETAKKAGSKKLLLTHFSNRHEKDREELAVQARRVFENTAAAEDGMELMV